MGLKKRQPISKGQRTNNVATNAYNSFMKKAKQNLTFVLKLKKYKKPNIPGEKRTNGRKKRHTINDLLLLFVIAN